VSYSGEVRGVCDDGFNEFEAKTACNELYGNPGVLSFT
jgi:hypothetical protein